MKVKRKKGFTLIEMVVSLATFSIVMLAITAILMSVIKFSSINNSTYKTDSISKVFFETLKEDRGRFNNIPKDSEKQYKAGFSNSDEVREFIEGKFLSSDPSNKPTTILDASDFNQCKENSSKYSMGIKVKWNSEGFYEIKTWCWDTNKGESSLISRATYVTPR